MTVRQNLSDSVADTAKRLSAVSLKSINMINDPFNRIDYQETLNPDKLQFPESMLSLYYHPIYATLSDEQKWLLSIYETINFFSLNIHGERKLVQGLEDRLYTGFGLCSSWDAGDYLQHFIHEENAHSHMLAGYCYRYGQGVLKDYSRSMGDPSLSVVGQELLFFGRVYLFEMFLDHLNSAAMRDDSLDSTARQVHRYHHMEEARHMAFDRVVVATAVEKAKDQDLYSELKKIRGLLMEYGELAMQSLYNPKIYKMIGLPNPVDLAIEARQEQRRLEVEKNWLKNAWLNINRIGLTNLEDIENDLSV